MAKVKVFLPQSDRVTDRQTGQKLDAPEFQSGGHNPFWGIKRRQKGILLLNGTNTTTLLPICFYITAVHSSCR